jgi:hypothetical protein
VDEDESVYCAGCGTAERVNWCPVYSAYLCDQCKWSKTEAELKPTGLIAALLAEPICECCPPV